MKRKLNGLTKNNLSIITKRILLIFIIFAQFFTISSLVLSSSSPWPMFRYNPQHTGKSPYKGAEQLYILKWKFKTGDAIYSSPAIGSDGTIYIGSDDHNLYAINPDGTLKWKFETGDIVRSSPAIGSDGTIYIGSNDNYFYAISPNGTLKWKFGVAGKIISSPAIGSDGTICFGGGDYIYVINPNGKLKGAGSTLGSVDSSPAIGSDGTIYIGSTDFYLYVINPDFKSKRKIGKFRIKDYASPAIGSDGTIYLGGNNSLYAINPTNRELKWSFEIGSAGAEVRSSPAIGSDGTIYVGSFDPNLSVFDLISGENIDGLYAINSDGTLKWKFETGGSVDSSPAIGSDGTIYVGSGNYIYAVNPNGSTFTRFETGGSVDSSPAIGSDGTIYVGSVDNCLYAIGGSMSSPQISETTYSLTGSLHCPEKGGYPCTSCSSVKGYINHFKGFNVLTTNKECYVKLIYNNGAYIGNQNNCEVTIKGEKWLGLENESGTKLVEEINKGNFDFTRANKFVERTMNFPEDNYKYEFANNGKEFRLYLSGNREETFKAVPWQNITIEIKNKETDKVFKYNFQKGIFPQAYSWSNGVANYGQCVWWAAKRWIEEVDSKTLFPFYPPSPQAVNVKTIDSNYQPKRFDILIDYNPRQTGELGHYGFIEKVEGDKMYISQFNWIKSGEIYNYIIRTWNGNATNLFYSYNPSNEYYFKYYYRK